MIEFDRTFDDWAKSLTKTYYDAIERAVVEVVLQKYAPQIEAWMKATAPWTDRTGNARQGLKAIPENDMLTNVLSIVLIHGMDYGKQLELRRQGRYAIIQPALDTWSPRVFAEVRRVMGG
jgi:hypothetical protein